MKKVSILEDVSRHFRHVQYLRTPQTGGGEVLWAPEDERQLMELSVTKNGLYKASDYLTNKEIPYWGFSQAVVNVQNAGKAIGIKPTDGNEYCVEVDENGNLTENMLPSFIRIDTPPTKLNYEDGDDVDITGMVVKAYKNTATLDDPTLTHVVQPVSFRKGRHMAYVTQKTAYGDNISRAFDAYDDVYIVSIITSNTNYHLYAVSDKPFGGIYKSYETSGSIVSNEYTRNGEIVYYFDIARNWSPLSSDKIEPSIPTTTVTIFSGETAWELMHIIKYGGLWTNEDYPDGIIPLSEIQIEPQVAHTDEGQSITVKWNRPYDQKELTDSFEITVEE